MKKQSFKEWTSTYIAKKPRSALLSGIILLNVAFLVIAACVISWLAPESLKHHGFWASLFYTVTMIFDAGCIQFVIKDIGTSGVVIVVACIIIIILGMIIFTSAVIGYLTNVISNFIEKVNSGKRKLNISNHTVIINWNSRASEIINELLYSEEKERIVILADDDVEDIQREIEERIADTLDREKKELADEYSNYWVFKRWLFVRRKLIKNNLTVIVRKGDPSSTKQLKDISLVNAKTAIILSKDLYRSKFICGYSDDTGKYDKGNIDTIKSLVQVSDIMGSDESADAQKIVVEVEDDWTLDLVHKIIRQKRVKEKSNIVPISINKALGQVLAQFSIMPDLNRVFNVLLSNKGAEFYCREVCKNTDEVEGLGKYLDNHRHAIPICTMDFDDKKYMYYVADKDKDVDNLDRVIKDIVDVKINDNYWLKQRNIVILGHNSKSQSIMDAFEAFRDEWNYKDNNDKDILNILVVDDQEHIEKMDNYNQYNYVKTPVMVDIYDRDKILHSIRNFVEENEGEDISILILSDDAVSKENMDSNAITYLVYVQDILKEMRNKTEANINIIVEIINPKNYDVVHNYSVENVIISNRYISKFITQVGEKDPLYNLFVDMLTYDVQSKESLEEYENSTKEQEYESKELYLKNVSEFFEEVPPEMSAEMLIRAVFKATPNNNKAVVIGMVDSYGQVEIFSGNQSRINVRLQENDKLIIYSNH